MLPEAAQSWAVKHSRPVLVMVTTLGATFLGQLCFAVLFFCGFPWPTWHATIPEAMLLGGGLLYFSGIYLRGPSFNGKAWYTVQSAISIPALMFLVLSPFVGPTEYVPFANPIVATAGISGGLFSLNLAGSLAGTVASTEAAAMEGLHVVLAQTALTTLRGMNSLTDYRLVRVLLGQVSSLPGTWTALKSSGLQRSFEHMGTVSTGNHFLLDLQCGGEDAGVASAEPAVLTCSTLLHNLNECFTGVGRTCAVASLVSTCRSR